ncbi:hypothetical protein KIMH_15340 [Bombiscardovia apis]|uniref:LytR/CpsA/Psr regulator C-terminal domain-containing protein n=1 Tax=Bombiscardovia apis TaxID=2932182 RepID=A0ABM8BER1_9BIFI|nr:LytR C-terminal domain-containing protein [Bombiscardovia apis]BDR55423.1 hypothetical protein KIMH_15340 [Bombiscardovia apis]
MTFPDALDEREARRQFVRRRQKMVFTIAISTLAVILVVALVFTLSAVRHSKKQTQQTKPNYGIAAPCAPANATVLNHPEVRVRVLNGTNKTGLGSAVMKTLRNRGFNMQGAGDFATKTELARTEIRFGANGISQGYTVAGQFSDAIMRMDDRQDDLVDVVIGATFNDLVKEKQVVGVGKPIESFKECVADPKTMKDLPKFE